MARSDTYWLLALGAVWLHHARKPVKARAGPPITGSLLGPADQEIQNLRPEFAFDQILEARGPEDLPKGVGFRPGSRHEAEVTRGFLEVGPKFFDLPPESRAHVLRHEYGHDLADLMLQDQSAFELADQGAFGPKLPDGTLKGINYQPTPAENVAEAYALLSGSDWTWLRNHYPQAFEAVGRRAIEEGFPIHPGARVALTPRERRTLTEIMHALQKAGVSKIISSDQDVGDLHGAAFQDGQEFVGYHVTDNPERVIRTLEQGVPLDQGRDADKFGDLCPGLYFSAAPQLWMGRAVRKWDFLERLTPDERQRLGEALLAHQNMNWPGYLTESEKEWAQKTIERFVQSGHTGSILSLADQPYNIAFWKPDFLEPLGITPAPQPQAVEVRVRGSFAEMDRPMPSSQTCELMKEAGLAGAFTRSGFATTPQMVVWKNDAVTQFGRYRPRSNSG